MNETKKMIIDAATNCFIRYGYSKTTLDDIGKNVGLKKNSLFYYFKNKEEIFIEVIKKELEDNLTEYETKVNEQKGVRQKLLTFITLRLKSCGQKSLFMSIFTETWTPRHPMYNHLFEFIREKEIIFLKGLFTRAHENSEVINYNFDTLSESILLICDSIKHHQMTFGNQEDQSIENDKQILFIIDTMLNGVVTVS